MWQRVNERADTLYHTNCKAWRRLCYCVCVWVGVFCQLPSQGFAPGEGQIESDQLLLHTAASYNLIWNASCSSFSCKIMTRSKLCQRYIKSKEEQHVLKLMSRLAQLVDLNPIELVWDGLDQNVRASAAQLWQILQESWAELSSVYLESLVERRPRICEEVIAAKGGHFDESKV